MCDPLPVPAAPPPAVTEEQAPALIVPATPEHPSRVLSLPSVSPVGRPRAAPAAAETPRRRLSIVQSLPSVSPAGRPQAAPAVAETPRRHLSTVTTSDRTPLRCRLWKGDLSLSRRRCEALKTQLREKAAELRRERRRRLGEERRWRALEKRLRTELSDAKGAVENLRTVMGGVFSKKQLAKLESGRRVNWSKEDIVKALVIRCSSQKCYNLLRDKFSLPLPGVTTLRRWTRGFRIVPGVLDMSLEIMRTVSDSFTSNERLVVLSFDEMCIDSRLCYDSTDDAVYGPHSHMQVMMIRSLCSHWKQPIYFDFDQDMTRDILFCCINAVEEAGYRVVATVCDLGATNRKLLWSSWNDKGLEINPEDPWFAHPRDSSRKIYAFADVPHLLKLLRNHILDQGLRLPGPEAPVLDKGLFQQLLARDNAELQLCHALQLKHIQVTGQERQRVRPAAQMLSERVGKCLLHLFGQRFIKQAEFIITCDEMFDTCNSRCILDGKVHRSAFGLEHTIDAQYTSLLEFTRLIRDSRVVGRQSRLPFQNGFIMSITALRGLYSMLKNSYDVKYFLTSRVNQDVVENFFSQVRGMGAANTHPTAVEAKTRVRLLLMGASPSVAAGSHARPQADGAPVLFEEEEPTYLSATTLQLDPPTVSIEEVDDVAAVCEDVERVQPCPAPPVPDNQEQDWLDDDDQDAAAEPTAPTAEGADQKLCRQALAYVAGFVASKCKSVDSSLGHISSTVTTAVDESGDLEWLQRLSRGGLTVPSEKWMRQVGELEVLFCAMHGPSDIDRNPGVIRRLTADVLVKFPDLHEKVARKYAVTRTHMRVKWLQRLYAEGKRKARAEQKSRREMKRMRYYLHAK